MIFIDNFSDYFNIAKLNNSSSWIYNRRVEIYNVKDLYKKSINKIQILNNDEVCETIYLTETSKDNILLDIYLKNGSNDLCILLVGENNVTQRSDLVHINVNIFPDTERDEELLTNFIGNDDQMTVLCTGNADLKYATPSAGVNKQVLIDLDIASHYFSLEGINSDLYQISKDNIPEIQSTIIPRPLTVMLNKVSKVYDGNCDITNEVKKLKLNDGYIFTDVNTEFNDFGGNGFVDKVFEKNINKTQLYKKDDKILNDTLLNSPNISLFSMELVVDGSYFMNMAHANTGPFGDGYTLVFDGFRPEYVDITEFKERTAKSVLAGKYPCNKLIYYEKKVDQIDGSTKSIFIGIDPIGCYNEDKVMIKEPLVYQNESFSKVRQWLKAFDHKIIEIRYRWDEDQNIILETKYFDDSDKYTVKDQVLITYEYNVDIENTYIESDYGYVKFNFDNAYFENKNVEDINKPIRLYNCRLEADTLGDRSTNYQIADYTIVGNITKRPIIPHVSFVDKIYDGMNNVAFMLDSAFYRGLENSIDGDDIKIDNTCIISEKTENGKVNVITGDSTFYFENADVGENKSIKLSNIVLHGEDATNYEMLSPIGNFSANIIKRPIKIKINRIRLYRSNLKYEVDYEFDDAIAIDNLTISVNSNDNYQFNVYARNLSENNLIDEYNQNEILSTYFTYDYNHDYKFEDAIDNKEIRPIYEHNTNKMVYYNVREAMPAEPNAERINIIPETNNKYTGNVSLNAISIKDSFTITDEFDNTKQYNISNIITSFFESQNNISKIYNGCKVKVTNICLDPNNEKTKNYQLLNNETETILEII